MAAETLSHPADGTRGSCAGLSSGFALVVMIGGAGGKDVTTTSWNYDFRNEIWMWNGEAWVQQFPANQPGPAYTVGVAWDEVREGLVVHLGDDLTCLTRGPMTFFLTGSLAGDGFILPKTDTTVNLSAVSRKNRALLQTK